VVTLFLLTVFGLLLGAGIKSRMEKAGLDTSIAWSTGRRWWEVSYYFTFVLCTALMIVCRNGCLGDSLKISASMNVLSVGQERGAGVEGGIMSVYRSLILHNNEPRRTVAQTFGPSGNHISR
jgi:hypothetical protein